MKYGGNTSCVTVETANTTIVLDAGTGCSSSQESGQARRPIGDLAAVAFPHRPHHRLPFFAPAWIGSFALTIMAGHLTNNGGVKDIFEVAMRDPVFPVKLADMGGATRFHDFHAGESFALGTDMMVRTARSITRTARPAYRLEAEGKAICYVTDTEHFPGKPDQNVLSLIRGADLVIYDSTYTDDEFTKKVGWGHSTWQEGVRLCRAAGAKSLAIFHHGSRPSRRFHGPGSTNEARQTWDKAFVAREGMVLPY